MKNIFCEIREMKGIDGVYLNNVIRIDLEPSDAGYYHAECIRTERIKNHKMSNYHENYSTVVAFTVEHWNFYNEQELKDFILSCGDAAHSKEISEDYFHAVKEEAINFIIYHI